MTKTKHTAGAWIAEHNFSGGIAIVSSHRRIHIAYVNKHAGMFDEDTANASLIVAAPAMLAALRAVLPYAESRLEDLEEDCELRGEDDELRKARAAYEAAAAAIAAAEGRR